MEYKKNYGNNITLAFCKKKYVIGNKFNISLLITMSFIYILIISLWILLLYKSISIYIIFLGIVLFLLLFYNYLSSFFTEPGIIPRNYKKYILNKEKKEPTIDSENY